VAELRVLTFTTLYPNAARPNHGVFVENRLRQTLARHEMAATVLAPVPFFPFTAAAFGAYALYARAPREEVRHGIAVHHPRFLLIPKFGMSAAPLLLYRGALAACRRLGLDKSKFDVIDAHYFYPDGVAAAWLAEALNLPFVVTARGSDLNTLAEFDQARRRILWAAERARAVITVSGALARRAVEIGIPETKLAVLRNGIDLDQFAPQDQKTARRRFGVSGFVIVSVGNLIDLKGHDLTIKAVAAVPGATLLIAGGGPLREALRAQAEALGAGGRVRFLGEVPHQDLALLYSAADVSVLMSEREGWANVLLESMACGTPVIATRVGGNAEVITKPEAGVLLPERSAAALTAALIEFRDRRVERTATRRHAEGFGWGAVAAGNYALLKAASNSPLDGAAQTIVAEAMRLA
jgi:glycosyltransferase involved in cell wall biosynthesis